jgi:N4-gp56 family major capsid protein
MTGYNPASNQTSNLPQSRIIYYDKRFIENLKAQTPFLRCAERRELPLNSGNQLELFMYNTFGANTVQASEGTVGTGITATVGTTTATIGEYADYANFSSLALATSLDNAVENVGRELSYRLGQTLSAIVRAVIDGSNSIDSSVATAIAGGTSLTLANIRSAVQSLAGRAVMPFDEGENMFAGVIHPFAVGDILNDSSNNSAIDILKRTVPGQMKMDDLVSTDLKETLEFPASGVSFFQSNLVTLTTTYKGSSGVTAYRTYIMGKDGVIAVRLGGRGDNAINDGNWRNIDVSTVTNPANSVADPSGLIGGWTSYRVHFTATLPPDTTQRLRYYDATSAIS